MEIIIKNIIRNSRQYPENLVIASSFLLFFSCQGEPSMLLGPNDAFKRNISDMDWVRVYNDVGEFIVRIKIAPSLRDGQALMYHAWEDYQFPGKGNMRHVTPSPLNPIDLTGDHPHLRPTHSSGQPCTFDRDALIEIKKISEDEVEQLKRGQAV